MVAFVLQPANLSKKSVARHYQDTIVNSVVFDDHRSVLEADQLARLEKYFPDGRAQMWGAVPGKPRSNGSLVNKTQYDKLHEGDGVAFYGGKKLYHAGRIAVLFRNPELATRLWGTDENGQTWELMYALTDLHEIDVPMDTIRPILGWSAGSFVQGFSVVEGEVALELETACGQARADSVPSSQTHPPALPVQLAALTADAVHAAIAEFDAVGREQFLSHHKYGKARDYFIALNGQLYDSKAIVGVAYGKLPGRKPLRPSEFSCGNQTVARRLEALGFHVVHSEDSGVPVQTDPHEYWWSGDDTENVWVEIRTVDGIGLSLQCPDHRQNGHRDPWFDLVSAVRKGDIVYHYSTRERRFVGQSVAAEDATHDRAEGAYSVSLTGFSVFDEQIDLAVMRSRADALFAERDRLAALYAGHNLYLPFQFREQRSEFRMLSNYFAKLPRSIINILFDGQSSGAPAPTPLSPPTGFLQPFKPKADTEYISTMAGGSSTRTRAHETLVNNFAEWLAEHDLVPMRNAAVDLGTEDPPTVIEAKCVNGAFADAIRAAVGQLYEYCYFQVADRDSGLIFLADEPIPEQWCRYLEDDREIGVIWPQDGDFHLSPLAEEYLGVTD
ncbi:hypothetical protein ACQP1O_33130 [Nocardia sp. CA-151230]|uniref:hypothetical protein n=1 Tax=Nocardia sp. CA-151230 TaxID=3239982 RepID=UPI003D8AD169